MKTNKHLKQIVMTGVAGLLLVAACTPTSTVGTPLATDTGLGTSVVLSPVATMQVTDAVGATSESTEAMSTAEVTAEGTAEVTAEVTMEATSASTEMATADGTAVATADGTAVATSDGTAVATSDGTAMPAMTGTPAASTDRPGVLLSTELIGSLVVDDAGAEVGEVSELLMDDQGMVQYLVIDATDYLAAGSTDATPVATAAADATESPMNSGYVAAPLNAFTVNEVTDDEARVLRYTGTADTLRGLAGFDTTLLDADGFMMDTTDSDVAANITYDGLIRVSRFTDFDLRNADGDELGEVEDLIVDVNAGQVTYGVVDFGGFLGIAEQTTAVPWTMFTVQETAATPNFMLDVNSDMLENAPILDLGAWPTWSERIEGQGDWMTDWDADTRTFWESAASSQ